MCFHALLAFQPVLSDELPLYQVSELKWQSVRDVEDVLKRLCQSFSFKVNFIV